MQNKINYLPFFLVFLTLSFILILFGTSGIYKNISSFFNNSTQFSRNVTNVLTLKSIQNKYIESLRIENAKIKKDLSDQKNILNENMALKSQFESSPEISQELLPVKIIGAPGFLPGISLPEYLILNKGAKAGIKNGDSVLSNNYLVGKIVFTSADISKVELVSNKNSSFTAKVQGNSDANGILKGQGQEEMIFDNVLLTTKLNKDDLVITKGDKNEKGEGYPPEISIGKIISIEKEQSDLFQKAIVKSPIDFKNLTVVFVLKN